MVKHHGTCFVRGDASVPLQDESNSWGRKRSTSPLLSFNTSCDLDSRTGTIGVKYPANLLLGHSWSKYGLLSGENDTLHLPMIQVWSNPPSGLHLQTPIQPWPPGQKWSKQLDLLLEWYNYLIIIFYTNHYHHIYWNTLSKSRIIYMLLM